MPSFRAGFERNSVSYVALKPGWSLCTLCSPLNVRLIINLRNATDEWQRKDGSAKRGAKKSVG